MTILLLGVINYCSLWRESKNIDSCHFNKCGIYPTGVVESSWFSLWGRNEEVYRRCGLHRVRASVFVWVSGKLTFSRFVKSVCSVARSKCIYKYHRSHWYNGARNWGRGGLLRNNVWPMSNGITARSWQITFLNTFNPLAPEFPFKF